MVLVALAYSHGDAVLLLEEPYGTFGSFNPTGHVAVYLSNVCADSPTHLRRCQLGESGIVISRYHRIAGYDWIAIPLIPYLYAVEEVDQIPWRVDSQLVAELRDRYRRTHLRAIAPDLPDGGIPGGDWYQLVGSAYDRTTYGFQVETRPEQDEALIEHFNRLGNQMRYRVFSSNCADFAASVMNFYLPHAIHRNYFADGGIMTPKQVAHSLVHYARRHPIVELSSFRIPQVRGNMVRSRPIDGVAETLLKQKKYVVPLVVFTPFIAGTAAVAYFSNGRFNPRHNAEELRLLRGAHPLALRAGNPLPPVFLPSKNP